MPGSVKCIFCGTQNGPRDRYCSLCRSALSEPGGQWKPPPGFVAPGTPRGLLSVPVALALVLVLSAGAFAAHGILDASSSQQLSGGVPAAPVATPTPTPRPTASAHGSSSKARPTATPGRDTGTSGTDACGTAAGDHGKAGVSGKAGENGQAGENGKAGENGNSDNNGQGLAIGKNCGTATATPTPTPKPRGASDGKP
jgi:hypothetical protein